jgi:16S rRNA (cytosine1402-N4)-methyltransferase
MRAYPTSHSPRRCGQSRLQRLFHLARTTQTDRIAPSSQSDQTSASDLPSWSSPSTQLPVHLDEFDFANLAHAVESIYATQDDAFDSCHAFDASGAHEAEELPAEQRLEMARSFHPAGRGKGSTMSSETTPTPDEVFAHVPVMKTETLNAVAPVANGLVIDATLGGAGHTRAILDMFPHVTVLGLDRDPFAIAAATARLVSYGDRAIVRQCRYDDIIAAVAEQSNGLPVMAVFFDLGVSSAQLDLAERGFSYRNDAPLDMRMDTTQGITAADVCNTYSERDLSRVLHVYGDEKFSGRVARAIIAHRPLLNTVQLAEIVTNAIPAATRRTGGHPAKRTFQALRIEVNDELRVLERALDAALDVLAPGGRCIVLSYHSGEDRIVKDRFREAETGGCACPSGLPCVCGALPRGRMMRRGVTRPTEAEIASNPRAASAVARVFVMAGSAGFPSPAAEPANDQTTVEHTSKPSRKSSRESSDGLSDEGARTSTKTSRQGPPVMARARRGEAARTSFVADDSSSAALLPRSNQ